MFANAYDLPKICLEKHHVNRHLEIFSICTSPNFHGLVGYTFTPQTAFENSVGKEEIARNEQFLLSPQCFLLNQKIVSPFVNIFDTTSLFAAELEEPKIGM